MSSAPESHLLIEAESCHYLAREQYNKILKSHKKTLEKYNKEKLDLLNESIAITTSLNQQNNAISKSKLLIKSSEKKIDKIVKKSQKLQITLMDSINKVLNQTDYLREDFLKIDGISQYEDQFFKLRKSSSSSANYKPTHREWALSPFEVHPMDGEDDRTGGLKNKSKVKGEGEWELDLRPTQGHKKRSPRKSRTMILDSNSNSKAFKFTFDESEDVQIETVSKLGNTQESRKFTSPSKQKMKTKPSESTQDAKIHQLLSRTNKHFVPDSKDEWVFEIKGGGHIHKHHHKKDDGDEEGHHKHGPGCNHKHHHHHHSHRHHKGSEEYPRPGSSQLSVKGDSEDSIENREVEQMLNNSLELTNSPLTLSGNVSPMTSKMRLAELEAPSRIMDDNEEENLLNLDAIHEELIEEGESVAATKKKTSRNKKSDYLKIDGSKLKIGDSLYSIDALLASASKPTIKRNSTHGDKKKMIELKPMGQEKDGKSQMNVKEKGYVPLRPTKTAFCKLTKSELLEVYNSLMPTARELIEKLKKKKSQVLSVNGRISKFLDKLDNNLNQLYTCKRCFKKFRLSENKPVRLINASIFKIF